MYQVNRLRSRSSCVSGRNTYIHTQGIRVGGGLHVDNVGHGTKVAGCAMSNTYGSARRGNAVAVAIDKNGKPYAS